MSGHRVYCMYPENIYLTRERTKCSKFCGTKLKTPNHKMFIDVGESGVS